MKKLIVIICILLIIFISLLIYRKSEQNRNITAQEVDNIQNYISEIYMWKEVTGEALPIFDNINNAPEKWFWEAIKKNIDNYDNIVYDDIQKKVIEIFGDKCTKVFPKEGNDVFIYNLYPRENTGKKEFISEVGTYIVSDTKVEVYIDPTGNTTDYRSMIKPELENEGKTLKYGYHVLKFKEPIELTGSKFRVVIKYSNMSDSYLTVPVERTIPGSLYEYATVSGKSYASADGYNWDPLQDSVGTSYDATVKAFTYYEEEPESITLDKTNAQIDLSSSEITLKLKETLKPESATTSITWSSSDEDVATVYNGVVTGKKNGTTTITAKTLNNLKATCKITVVTSPKNISLDKTEITLYTESENTYKLNAKIEPVTSNYQNNLIWSSDNSEIASVDEFRNGYCKK